MFFQLKDPFSCNSILYVHFPRVAPKILFKTPPGEKAEANLFHSFSSSFPFLRMLSGLVCFFSTFHRHLLQQPLPLPSCYGSHPHISPRQLNTTAVFWKTFHGLTIAFNKWRGGTSVPMADLFKLLWNNWNDNKAAVSYYV